MKAAIGKYKSGKFGLNEMCRRYNIPKTTFKRHLLGTNTKAKAGIKSLGRLNVFSAEIEQDLENQILKMEECFFGLTIRAELGVDASTFIVDLDVSAMRRQCRLCRQCQQCQQWLQV
nr:unnamed protein product [Callosobruchus chinensis]